MSEIFESDEVGGGTWEPEFVPCHDDPPNGPMTSQGEESGIVSLSECLGNLRRSRRLLEVLGRSPDFFTQEHYNRVLKDIDIVLSSIWMNLAESDKVDEDVSSIDFPGIVHKLPSGSRIILERD